MAHLILLGAIDFILQKSTIPEGGRVGWSGGRVGWSGRVGWLDKLKIRLNSAQIGVGVGLAKSR